MHGIVVGVLLIVAGMAILVAYFWNNDYASLKKKYGQAKDMEEYWKAVCENLRKKTAQQQASLHRLEPEMLRQKEEILKLAKLGRKLRTRSRRSYVKRPLLRRG